MSEPTLVLNASYEVLAYVDWTRAVTMVTSDLAIVVESDPDRQVRSAYLSLPWPTVIMLKKYVYVPHVGYGGDGVSRATRKAILARDKRRCAYCGKAGSTIDHIFPRSRGGLDSWENLITACGPCNHRKADRTPDEAGMRLLWQPRRVELHSDAQAKVWKTHAQLG